MMPDTFDIYAQNEAERLGPVYPGIGKGVTDRSVSFARVPSTHYSPTVTSAIELPQAPCKDEEFLQFFDLTAQVFSFFEK